MTYHDVVIVIVALLVLVLFLAFLDLDITGVVVVVVELGSTTSTGWCLLISLGQIHGYVASNSQPPPGWARPLESLGPMDGVNSMPKSCEIMIRYWWSLIIHKVHMKNTGSSPKIIFF